MIEFQGVAKSFGNRDVLKGLSFSVARGEILFVLGTSGTGKSVLLKTMVGLIRPTKGEIWIDGLEVTGLTESQYREVRRDCGMVFQHPALFDSLTIYENVAFGLRRHYPDWEESRVQARVQEVLRLVHIQGVENLLPGEISYGMQKRVSLARTLALAPRILLFDEPTTGLDPVTTTAINQLIFDLSRKLKTTSLVVSHDMRCALAIADRIVVLDQGEIVAQGSPAELRKSSHPLVRDFLLEVDNGEDSH